MGAAFDKLSGRAKRAAFAKMDRKSGAGTPGPSAGLPVIDPVPGGGFASAGRISQEKAAEIMFGTRGAAARIAKAKRKGRAKRPSK